jgi:hypothetical protein
LGEIDGIPHPGSQGILYPVIQLVDQQLAALFMPTLIGDVARYLRCPNNAARGIHQWRDGQGNIDKAPVFANADRLIMINVLPAPYPVENSWFLILPVWWDQYVDGLADDLAALIAKQALGALIPGLYDSICILAADSIS